MSQRTETGQTLGTVRTHIAGTAYYDADAQPGEKLQLEREPENEHDGWAIRVENHLFHQVGHVPRRVAAWLSPLIDAGKVHAEARVPDGGDWDADRPLLELELELWPKGRSILAPDGPPSTIEEAIHRLVVSTFLELDTYPDADLVRRLGEELRALTHRELLPETRMLLALFPAKAREVKRRQTAEAARVVRDWARRVRIGTPVAHGNVVLFPVTDGQAGEDGPSPFVLAETALEQGTAVVEEVDESGVVGRLRVKNESEIPLIIPEGDVLEGAKQNRVVHRTVLVAAKESLVMPVSCVEQGRWSYRGRHFRTSSTAPPSVRHAYRATRRRGGRTSAEREREGEHRFQQAVWHEVAACLGDVEAVSATDSLTDGFERLQEELAEFTSAVELPDQTIGVVVQIGENIAGFDLFGRSDLFRARWERLGRSYAFDAIRRGTKGAPRPVSEIEQFVKSLAESAEPVEPSQGLGTHLEMATDTATGGALVYQGGVCHWSAVVL